MDAFPSGCGKPRLVLYCVPCPSRCDRGDGRMSSPPSSASGIVSANIKLFNSKSEDESTAQQTPRHARSNPTALARKHPLPPLLPPKPSTTNARDSLINTINTNKSSSSLLSLPKPEVSPVPPVPPPRPSPAALKAIQKSTTLETKPVWEAKEEPKLTKPVAAKTSREATEDVKPNNGIITHVGASTSAALRGVLDKVVGSVSGKYL